MTVILEPRLKRELADSAVPVPVGHLCRDAISVGAATEALGGTAVVKAVVPTGRKGKAGAVVSVRTPGDARAEANRLLGSIVHGFPVEALLVEERVSIERELYVVVRPDGLQRGYTVAIGDTGGVEIEENSGRIETLTVRPDRHVPEFTLRRLAGRIGLTGPVLRTVGRAITGITRLAIRRDLTLLEVNPLAVLADGTVSAVGVLGSVDESAMQRQRSLVDDVVEGVDRVGRPLTRLEKEIEAINRTFPDHGHIRFQEFIDGDLGFMVMGGGAGLVALDELQRLGGRPATFFDMTAGDVEDKICAATQAILAVERLRGLMIGVNISAYAPVPIRVAGIARALKASSRDFRSFPVAIRLAGPHDDEAAEIMRDFADVDYYRDEVTLEEAVAHFVRRVEARQP